MDSPSDVAEEVARIRTQYARYDDAGLGQTLWAPFNADEAAFRAQQIIAFAALMRGIARCDLSGLRILDLGCGRGRMLRALLDMGAAPDHLVGVDVYERGVEDARKLSPFIEFQVCSGDALAFDDNSFDIVMQWVVFSSVAHVQLRRRLASEMWRVVKPGGFVFWWDMIHMSSAAGGRQVPLDYEPLFPGVASRRLEVGPSPRPSETLRCFPGSRLLGSLLDRMGKPATHCAALIGPKLAEPQPGTADPATSERTGARGAAQ